MKKISIKNLIRIALIMVILSVLCVNLAVPAMAMDMPKVPGEPGYQSQPSSSGLGMTIGLFLGAGATAVVVVIILIAIYLFFIKPKPKKTEVKIP